ncbi:MAG: metallophosphoesterase family protein [Bacteroidota bacterium]|nr:metallophosphoesterase family protein [Bacteroidota bacterium]
MNITLLSDTHGYIDARILRHVEGSDEVWHAGDIGTLHVTDALSEVAPCRAVFGNIDDDIARRTYPEHAHFVAGGMKVWMTHIGGRPPRYAKGMLAQLKANPPDLFVCGHSHILLVQKVAAWGGLHLNPGAAGIAGFHKVCTMLKFQIQDSRVCNMRVIEWPRKK